MTEEISEEVFKGANGDLVVTNDAVIIQRGAKGFLMTRTMRGEKRIPFRHITAVQYHKFGLTTGYLQVSTTGGSEAKRGLHQAKSDENTVTFLKRRDNEEFARARDLILQRMEQAEAGTLPGSAHEKICPECAESVKVAANVCRFCGHRFA